MNRAGRTSSRPAPTSIRSSATRRAATSAGRVLLPAARHDRQRRRAVRARHLAQLLAAARRSPTRRGRASTAFYFQDRWKPTGNISIKAGFRIDTNSDLHEGSRGGARPGAAARLPDGDRRQGVRSNALACPTPASRGTRAVRRRPRARRAATTSGWTSAAATARRTRRTWWRPNAAGESAHRGAEVEPNAARPVCARRRLRRRKGRQHPQRPHT